MLQLGPILPILQLLRTKWTAAAIQAVLSREPFLSQTETRMPRLIHPEVQVVGVARLPLPQVCLARSTQSTHSSQREAKPDVKPNASTTQRYEQRSVCAEHVDGLLCQSAERQQTFPSPSLRLISEPRERQAPQWNPSLAALRQQVQS